MNSSAHIFSTFAVLLALNWVNACAGADPEMSVRWRDGLKLLDSSSQADIAAAEHMLRQVVTQGKVPPEALCTFALLQLRQHKPAEALTTVAELARTFDANQRERTAALASRIQLYAALASEDRGQADSAFKALVRQIVAERGDVTELRFSAITIGVVTAMLETELADSPISARDLAIGRDCMLQSSLPGVAVGFTSAYEQASERTVELVRQFQFIQDRGIDVAAAENAAGLQALDMSLAEFTEQKELAAEIFRNAREQTEQNTRDRRKIERLITSINSKLRQTTPGHPGPQRPAPPPPPPRSSVYVDELEIRTEFEYVSRNGELVRIPVTREYRRSQADIDYERNSRYERILGDYQRVKADYDRYLTSYNAALTTWTAADRVRRQELNDQKAEAEAQRAELLAASERIKAEKSAVAQDVVKTRTAREQAEFELELQSIAIEAARAQKISAAFRPSHFPVLSWSQEKALLLRNTQDVVSVKK